MIDAYSAALARAETDLDQADQSAASAAAHADVIRSRLAEQNARLDSIRADLAAGKLSAKEAGGLAGLAISDRDDLAGMLGSANADAAASHARAAAASHARDTAREALDRAAAAEEFAALTARVDALDSLLCDAVGELFVLGVRAGRPRVMSAVWRPSSRLHRAVALRVPPGRDV